MNTEVFMYLELEVPRKPRPSPDKAYSTLGLQEKPPADPKKPNPPETAELTRPGKQRGQQSSEASEIPGSARAVPGSTSGA